MITPRLAVDTSTGAQLSLMMYVSWIMLDACQLVFLLLLLRYGHRMKNRIRDTVRTSVGRVRAEGGRVRAEATQSSPSTSSLPHSVTGGVR